jgi:hypothetical protein
MCPVTRILPFLCGFGACLASVAALAQPTGGNRLTYLDSSDPFYVGRDFPKLITPQWIGEPAVKAVVVLSIDDMRGDHPARTPRVYEAVLRPALDRLRKIDGRAPVSIMTNRINPNDPHLQAWLKEGLSLEVHTIDHPCPFLAGGDFAKAKGTYDQCVDLMHSIPGSRAVAFRMPCCDSIDSPSPRFYDGIFDRLTEKGNFLQIDSSVMNITSSRDASLPRELTTDPTGTERFAKYAPFEAFVTTVDDYPYPYLINRVCWELPCALPSDWEAQHLHGPNNPKTLEDWKALLDATVIKQGTMTIVFHPHGWIRPEQVAEFVDYADAKYGKAVKFLSFREVLERLNANLLTGQTARAADGSFNGIRLMDLDGDGLQDVVIGNDKLRKTRVWSRGKNNWVDGDFPVRLTGNDVRFGIVAKQPVCMAKTESTAGAWQFTATGWVEDPTLHKGLDGVFTSDHGKDRGVRLRDLDADGTCELIVSNDTQQAIYAFDVKSGWSKLPFTLPPDTSIVDAQGHDAGLRFVDVNEDGKGDVVFSNDARYSLHLFTSMKAGWSNQVLSGKRGDKKAEDELPRIVRGTGENNGAWFKNRHMWVQNEDTATLPNIVDRRSFADLLKQGQPAAPRAERKE